MPDVKINRETAACEADTLLVTDRATVPDSFGKDSVDPNEHGHI